jgi:hypothetical protein
MPGLNRCFNKASDVFLWNWEIKLESCRRFWKGSGSIDDFVSESLLNSLDFVVYLQLLVNVLDMFSNR